MDIGAIMQAAQKMQERMAEVEAELGKKTVEAQAGGGMVTVTATGAREIARVRIDPAVVDAKDVAMLEDLVVAATNAALRKAADLAREQMSSLTAGLPIPPGLL